MQRRNFIKKACSFCLLTTAAGMVAADLAACSPATGSHAFRPPVKNNMVEIPLSLFINQSFVVISPAKYEYEIAIAKKGESEYTALLLKCTHYQNQLTVTGNGFTCTAHGSKFDKVGNVLKGPAENALQQLKIVPKAESLVIYLV